MGAPPPPTYLEQSRALRKTCCTHLTSLIGKCAFPGQLDIKLILVSRKTQVLCYIPLQESNISSYRCWCEKYNYCFKPLMPVQAVTRREERWPLFYFWRHHIWPKLPLSILKFCRKKRSFQWYPDQSDQLNGAWTMHENAQKFEGKTRSKISCDYTWLLYGKSCPSRWCLLGNFWTGSKLSRRSITAAKNIRKGQRGKAKKIKKPKKDIGSLSHPKTRNFDFCTCTGKK